MKKLESQTLNDWVQIVGIFALVASLVFVGVEVRQNSVATRAATNAAVKDAFRELNIEIATSRELAEALVRSYENPELASPEDRLQVRAMWRALFHVWSNVHRQHLNGTLDPALYDAVVQEISTYAGHRQGSADDDQILRRSEQMRRAWDSERYIYNPDFQEFVDGILGVKQANDELSELRDFATRYAAAWSGQDPKAFAAFYAENAAFSINGGEKSVGREAIENTADAFMSAFPDMHIRMLALKRNGQTIEFHWHWTGTNTGPGGTGAAVDLKGFEQWTLDENGLILETRGNMDDAEYQRQLHASAQQ